MSENTTTGGLVEELRALHVRVETPMFGGVEHSCRGCGQDWPCDTTSLLDAHASRTAEARTDPRCQHGVPGACASAPAGLLGDMWQPDRAESVPSLASSSPEPGAVEALAWLLGVTRFGATPEHIANMQEIRPSWVPFENHDRELARAVLTAGYLSPADVGRVVAAAKAEARDEGASEVEEEWQEWCRTALVEWEAACSAAVAAEAFDQAVREARSMDEPTNMTWFLDALAARNPYRAAGPERRTEPDEAVSADD